MAARNRPPLRRRAAAAQHPCGALDRDRAKACWHIRYAGVFAMRVSLSACARERRLAQQMRGGAADAIRLDSGGGVGNHLRALPGACRPALPGALPLSATEPGLQLRIPDRAHLRRAAALYMPD